MRRLALRALHQNQPQFIFPLCSADTSLHIEGFYQFQITENIAITLGVIWITAPGFNQDNNDIVIGAIRTTFTF